MSAQSPADSATEPAPSVSRRSMLRGAAGVGAAGLAAAAVASTAAPALAAPRAAAPAGRPVPGRTAPAGAGPADAAEPVVVHLRDAASGEMDIFAGTSHTRLRDPDLAARLTRAAR